MSISRRTGLAGCLLVAALAAFGQTVPLDALLRGGRIHYSGGRYDRAREQFQRAFDQYAATAERAALAELHLWLGLCDAQARSFGPAADHFLKAVELDTSLPGRIRRDEGQLYHAGTSLLKAAQTSYEAGEYDRAIGYARAALAVDPSKPQIYSLIANAYSAEERYEDMLATARTMLQLDTASAEAWGLIGLYFLQKPDSLWPTPEARRGRWDSTLFYYRRALSTYESDLAAARKLLEQVLRATDAARLTAVEETLYRRSRSPNQEGLRRYIETGLGQTGPQLTQTAQVASRVYYARSRLNLTCGRAGSAMLRASYETRGDTADRFRAQAETLFARAVEYDQGDYNGLLNLGIALYGGRQDSTAASVFGRVVEGAVAPLALLPAAWQETLLAQVTPAAVAAGNLQLSGEHVGALDSILDAAGRLGTGYGWLYFPELRGRQDFTAATSGDAAAMFVSTESPAQLENAYLLLGASQTGFADAQRTAGHREVADRHFRAAIDNLVMVTKMNPASAEAYQNLVTCYRETGQQDKAAAAYELQQRYSRN